MINQTGPVPTGRLAVAIGAALALWAGAIALFLVGVAIGWHLMAMERTTRPVPTQGSVTVVTACQWHQDTSDAGRWVCQGAS